MDEDGIHLVRTEVHGLNKQIPHVLGVIITLMSSYTEIPFEHFLQVGNLSNKFTIYAQLNRPKKQVLVFLKEYSQKEQTLY